MILGYLKNEYINYGVKVPVSITLAKQISSILICGKSGSGKTLSVEWYLWNMLNNHESIAFVSDYKADEALSFLEGSSSYASASEAVKMIEDFYEFFSVIRNNRIRLNTHYTIIIEEWAGLVNSSPKQLKVQLQEKLAEIMMVGRGLNIGVILCVQRADATLFSSGATRDQFQAILSFARATHDAYRMLGFSGELEENPTQNYKSGQALLLVDGQDSVKEIIVPQISNSETMLKGIRQYLDLQPNLETLIRSPDLWE